MAVTADKVVVEISAELGDYEVKLARADRAFGKATGSIERNAGRTEKAVAASFASLGRGLGVAAGLVGISATAIGLGLAAAVGASIRFVANLKKQSEQLNVSTQSLQFYTYAASSLGIEQEKLSSGLGHLNDTLGKASLGAEAPIKALKAFGFTLKEIRAGIATDAAFPRIAEGLSRIESPAKRAAAATLFFGDAAKDLAPLTDKGAAGIDGMRSAFDRLGITLSNEQIKRFGEAEKKLRDIKVVLETKLAGAVAENIDTILAVADAFIKVAEAAGKAIGLIARFSDVQAFSNNSTFDPRRRAAGNRLIQTKEGRRDVLTDLSQRIAMNERARSGLGGLLDRSGLDRELKELKRQQRVALTAEAAAHAASQAGVVGKPGGAAPDVSNLLAPKPPKGRSGPSAEEIAARFANELAREKDRQLSLESDLTADFIERNKNEREANKLHRDAAIQDVLADKYYSDAQKTAIVSQLEANAALEDRVVNFHEQAQLEENRLSLLTKGFQIEEDLLSTQAGMAQTATERRDLELRLLALQHREEEERLKAITDIANKSATPQEKREAQQQLNALPAKYAGQEAAARRGTMGPLEQFRDSIPKTAAEINEALESIEARGLQSLTDGITEAIMGAKSLGDVFKNVANQIIADLIRIAVQQAIVGPLAGALFGGGGKGGGFLGGLFGFAGGGSGTIGGRGGTDTNTLSLNGRPFANVTRGETLNIGSKPLRGGGGGATVVQYITVDGRNSVTPDNFARQILSISGQQAQHAAATMGKGVLKAMPARLSQFQADGT